MSLNFKLNLSQPGGPLRGWQWFRPQGFSLAFMRPAELSGPHRASRDTSGVPALAQSYCRAQDSSTGQQRVHSTAMAAANIVKKTRVGHQPSRDVGVPSKATSCRVPLARTCVLRTFEVQVHCTAGHAAQSKSRVATSTAATMPAFVCSHVCHVMLLPQQQCCCQQAGLCVGISCRIANPD